MLTVPCVCLLLLLTNLFHVIDAECTLKCPANSECVEEPADFSNHEIYDSMETMFVQHNTVTSNQHCICPPGLTGVMCDRPYEGCDGAHKCYVSLLSGSDQKEFENCWRCSNVFLSSVLHFHLIFIHYPPTHRMEASASLGS
jgi:hypothetical protein